MRDHLKLMLDAGVIRPSNSPWCNAVVLVRKKDGSLCFCIDFRRLNSLTVKDSYPLPRICETLESLAGAGLYSTFDMNSGFWQVPMSKEIQAVYRLHFGKYGPLRVREHAVWTMQCSAYFPKAHAELSRRVKSNVLPHLSR